MARTPTLHSSILGGAGVLSPLEGSLLTLLDKVLVDGYTSSGAPVASLGWSRPFLRVDNVCAYKPPLGTGLMYRINDAIPSSGGRIATIQGYESMPNVTTGFGYWAGLSLGKTAGVDVTVPLEYSPSWWIVGDGMGFYLMIGDHDAYDIDPVRGVPVIIHYIGDFDSFLYGDTFNAAILAHSNSYLLASGQGYSFFKNTGATNTSGPNGKVYKNADGTVFGKSVVMPTFEGIRQVGTSSTTVLPSNLSLGAAIPRLQPVLIGSNEEGFTNRGKVPGLHTVWPNITGATGDTFSNNEGTTYMLLNVCIAVGLWEQYALQLNSWS